MFLFGVKARIKYGVFFVFRVSCVIFVAVGEIICHCMMAARLFISIMFEML